MLTQPAFHSAALIVIGTRTFLIILVPGLESVYVKGKTYEDIVRETGCGKNTPKKWCRIMTERLSIKLFGAKAIEK